jgi:NADPH:quinone reductase-like Zn-dependent oxidoreductase
LVKTSHVGICPSDNLFISYPPFHIDGLTIGSDYCGTVVDVDPAVKHIKKDDRVAGAVFATCVASQPDGGTFAEYVLAKADAMLRLDDMGDTTDAQGATLGVSVYTVYRTLYYGAGLPLPGTESWNKTILIYGGSTTSGLLMMQFSKLSGAQVIATASRKNFDLVKSYGADIVVNYHDSEVCAREIIEATSGKLDIVVDCVGIDSTVDICDKVLASRGQYFVLTPSTSKRDDVTTTFNPGQDLIGEPYIIGGQTITIPPATEEARSFLRLAETFFREGKTRHIPIKVSEGWTEVLERGNDLREGKASGFKYVVKVA